MARTIPGRSIFALALLVGIAQTEPPVLERVEEGVEDADPLAASFAEPRADLRPPAAFEHVYRVPGRDDLFMRADGGLYAVFPQSEYMRTPIGSFPVIPANTIYYIGLDDIIGLAGPATDRSNPPVDRLLRADEPEATRIDLAATLKRDDREATSLVPTPPDRKPRPGQGRHHGTPQAEEGQTTLPRLTTDPEYRARRLRELLIRAAHHAQTPPASGD